MAAKTSGHGHDEHGHGGHDDHAHGEGPHVHVDVVPQQSIEDSILRIIALVAFVSLLTLCGFWRLSTEALPTPQVIEHGEGHGGAADSAERGAIPGEHSTGPAEHGAVPVEHPAVPATGAVPAEQSVAPATGAVPAEHGVVPVAPATDPKAIPVPALPTDRPAGQPTITPGATPAEQPSH